MEKDLLEGAERGLCVFDVFDSVFGPDEIVSFKKKFDLGHSALSVEAGTNGYYGTSCRSFIFIKNESCTNIGSRESRTKEGVNGILLDFQGESELGTIIDGLKFAACVLESQLNRELPTERFEFLLRRNGERIDDWLTRATAAIRNMPEGEDKKVAIERLKEGARNTAEHFCDWFSFNEPTAEAEGAK